MDRGQAQRRNCVKSPIERGRLLLERAKAEASEYTSPDLTDSEDMAVVSLAKPPYVRRDIKKSVATRLLRLRMVSKEGDDIMLTRYGWRYLAGMGYRPPASIEGMLR